MTLIMLACSAMFISAKVSSAEVSIMDVTELADIIVKGDRIHFIAQVQTNGNILYSSEPRNGTYLSITYGSNVTGYAYQFEESLTQNPLENLYRLHIYIDTTALTEGNWNYTYHVEVAGEPRRDSTMGQFHIRPTDGDPVIVDNTEEEFTNRENVLISASVTDPDGDDITGVEVEINGTVHPMEMDGTVFTKDVGRMPVDVDFYIYNVYTGRKKDGDNESAFSQKFHITIKESGLSRDDTLPEVKDGTQLPDKVTPDTSITFTVSYRDDEGDPPEKVELTIFNVTSGAELLGRNLLTEGGDFRVSVMYRIEVNLSAEGISEGKWTYKIKYGYNGSHHILVQKDFTVEKKGDAGGADSPILMMSIDPVKPKPDDQVEFTVKWNAPDGTRPTSMTLRFRDDGSMLAERSMIRSSQDGKWDMYAVMVDLGSLGAKGNSIEYNVTYVHGGSEHPGPEGVIELDDGNGPQEDPQILLIVIVILITIVVLLSLFVFTFGKRDPY